MLILPAYRTFPTSVRDNTLPMGERIREFGRFPTGLRAIALRSAALPQQTSSQNKFTRSASNKSPRPKRKCWSWLTS